ncbi:MAG: alpha/beta hydrolase [Deltaproteobacteria bacterium]|nr:alpha/beta hydrolase [Deltaproteobacteria bacterium]
MLRRCCLTSFIYFICLWLSAGVAPKLLQAAAINGPRMIKDISYPGAVAGDRRRSLDLYLPADSAKKPPLLAFVHGGFWLLTDDDYRIGVYIAEALTREGIAVALIRYRLAPAAAHPAQTEDVAAAVALLMREAGRYGYDSSRIFLAGHSAGGHLATLVALDASYLGKHNLNPKSLAGVVSFSGLYDLAPKWKVTDNQISATVKTFGTDGNTLKRASPVTHVRADAPPLLLLNAQNDFPGFAIDSRNFHEALRRAGHKFVERWLAPERDHFTLMRLDEADNEARMLLLDFVKAAPLVPEFKILVDARRRWRDPPFSTQPFWRHEKLVRAYPVDQRFVDRVGVVYSTLGYELKEWPLKNFHAIGLSDYLNSIPAEKIGRGDYLVTTNIRGEKQFWLRAQIEAYKPVIVVGLDDEKNMFKLGVFYRALREYSWKSAVPPPMMARPLGAFLHFLNEPPQEFGLQAAQFGLTEDSFRLVANDPLARFKDLRKDLYETVTVRNGCVYCNGLRGTNVRSHHIVAGTGTAYGGEALALESYPPEVWRAFIFDQINVAKKIGASPNVVAESVRQELFELVNQSRRSMEKK